MLKISMEQEGDTLTFSHAGGIYSSTLYMSHKAIVLKDRIDSWKETGDQNK